MIDDRDPACPACRSGDLSVFVDVERLPALVCAGFSTAEQARAAESGRVTLAHCHECGLIHNSSFEPEKIDFEVGYDASLAHTATFRGHVHDLVARLVDRYGLRGRSVLEIGCGDGYLLRALCSAGGNEGIGIDPTIATERVEPAGAGSVRYIADYFSERYAYLTPDFVCSMSVFETVPDPLALLRLLHRMTRERGASLYFEVPSAAYMFERMSTWSIYYEQFGHFTADTLAGLFRRAGFAVIDSGGCYTDGQYVFVEARPARNGEAAPPTGATRRELPASVRAFADRRRRDIEEWRARLGELREAGRKVIAWGSGGKGNSFLNVLETQAQIRYVVDINPNRQGKYVPGSAQEIVPPAFLAEYEPDVVIVTNPVYEQEIRALVRELGVSCDFLTLR